MLPLATSGQREKITMSNHSNSSQSLFFSDDSKIIRLLLAIILILLFFVSGYFWTLWVDGNRDGIKIIRFVLTPLAAMGLALLIGARYVQDIYELPSYRVGLRYIFSSITGLFYPYLNVTDGRPDIEPGEVNLLDKIGGPGVIAIEPGNIVLLERLDSPSDVLGAGYHFVNRFHRIKNIISLKDQHAAPRDIVAITKDGISVTVHDFQFRFRLETGHQNTAGPNQRTMLNPYPYSVKAAKNMTYSRSIAKDGTPVAWEKAVQFSIDGAITDYINQHFLDQILFPASNQDDPRSEMSKIITAKKWTSLKMYGAELLWHDIGHFEVDPAIGEQMMKAWNAKWAGNATILRAQGEAMQIANQERGRAEGEVNMLTSIIQALDYANLPENIDENMWNIVLSRTAQVIESMTKVSYSEDTDKNKKE